MALGQTVTVQMLDAHNPWEVPGARRSYEHHPFHRQYCRPPHPDARGVVLAYAIGSRRVVQERLQM